MSDLIAPESLDVMPSILGVEDEPATLPPRIMFAEPEGPSKEQQLLFSAYANLSRSIAHVTTQFHEQDYLEPDTRKPSLWRFWVPKRKPTGATIGQTISLEDLVRASKHKDIVELDAITKESIQHQVIKSLLHRKDLTLTGIPAKQQEVAQKYASYLSQYLAKPLSEFVDALPRPLREHSEEFFDKINLHEHFTNAYLYVLADKRIDKPEIAHTDTGDQIVSGRTILPLSHYLKVLSLPDSWWAAANLHFQYRRFGFDNTVKIDIGDHLVKWMRKKWGHDPNDFFISEDNADEYAVHRFLQEAPGAIPILREMAAHLDKYVPGTLKKTLEGITRSSENLGIRVPGLNKSELAGYLADADILHYDPVNVDQYLTGATTQEAEFAHWFAKMLSDVDVLATTQKHIFVSPLVGWNVKDDAATEENVTKGPPKISDRKHALLLRDGMGHYPVLEDELNRRSGPLYKLTHEAFLIGSAALHEIAKDGSAIVDKFSDFTPLPSETQERVHNLLKERLGFTGRHADAYDRLQKITFERSESVVKPNKFGAFVRDHRLAITSIIGTAIVRNAWDHARGDKLHVFGKKLVSTVRSGKWLPFLADILSYRPEDAHDKTYGPIEAEELPAAFATLDMIADYQIGKHMSDGWNERRKRQRLVRKLGDEMLTHEDNVYTLFANGLLLYQHGMINDAQEQLLDVKGWITHGKESQFEDSDRDKRMFLYHQLLSATEYYLADIFATKAKPIAHIETLRSSYQQYKERKVMVDRKSEGGNLMVKREERIHFDFAENEPKTEHELMFQYVLSPVDFRVRRRTIAHIYAKDKNATYSPRLERAREMVRRAYSDLNELGAILSVHDVVEAGKIADIGKLLGVAIPDYLSRTLSHHPGYAEALALDAELPKRLHIGTEKMHGTHEHTDKPALPAPSVDTAVLPFPDVSKSAWSGRGNLSPYLERFRPKEAAR